MRRTLEKLTSNHIDLEYQVVDNPSRGVQTQGPNSQMRTVIIKCL